MGSTVFPPASSGAVSKVLKEQVFTTSGTWTYPTSSNFNGEVEITCVGGGGGGGSFYAQNAYGTPYGVTGGGGGGRVILNKTISVLNGGNQNVTVGLGGPSDLRGVGQLNGLYSAFGNNTIANLYPDPELTAGYLDEQVFNTSMDYLEKQPNYNPIWQANVYHRNSITVSSQYPFSASTGSVSSAPVRDRLIYINKDANYYAYFQYLEVKPSVSYKLNLWSRSYNSTTATTNAYVKWYDSRGIIISTSNLGAIHTSSSTWTFFNGSVTSPSTAVYGRILLGNTSASNCLVSGMQLAPASLALTDIVTGGTSGYAWLGTPGNSETIVSTGYTNSIFAQGGGAGWGITQSQSNSNSLAWTVTRSKAWSSGGATLPYGGTSTNYVYVAGDGGGSDYNAIPLQLNLSTSSLDVISTSLATTSLGHNLTHYNAIPVSGGSGTFAAQVYNSAVNNLSLTHSGAPGAATNGYGSGGLGAILSNNTKYISSPMNSKLYISGAVLPSDSNITAAENNNIKAVKPNTGTGGSGVKFNGYPSSESGYYGANGTYGSSGVVIVRWYE